MMSELILTSLFCDEVETFFHDIDAIDDIIKTSETAASSSQMTSESTTPSSSVTSSATPQALWRFVSCAVEAGISKESLNSALLEFEARVVGAAVVDLSTLLSHNTHNVFANDYICPITYRDAGLTPDVKKPNSKSRRHLKCWNYVDNRPPYTYSAMAAAAIYASGKPTLNTKEIVEELFRLFGDDAFGAVQRSLRKNLSRALERSKLFRVVSERPLTYELIPGVATPAMFQRMSCDFSRSQRYAPFIYDYLNLPGMLADLGKQSCEQKNAPTRLKRASSTNGELKPAKRQRLKMPLRPCFQDDNDGDKDELFVCSSVASSVPEFFNDVFSDTRTDVTRQPAHQQLKQQNLQSHHQQQHQVVATGANLFQECQTKNVASGYVPLPSCQQASIGHPFIPGSGIVSMVDVLVNGQILRVPLTPVFISLAHSV